MQKKIVVGICGFGALVLPSFVFAAPQTFSELVYNLFLPYINLLIPIVIAAAVVLYMKNTATGLYNLKGGKVDPDWQKSMIWGIIILTMMVSLWGILSIIQNTIF